MNEHEKTLDMLREQKKETAKKLRETKKAIIDHKKRLKTQSTMDQWKELTKVKQQLEAIIQGNDACKGWSLKRIAGMTEYYTHQHTTKKQLKASDGNADWIKDFTGDEASLLAQADKTRLTTWERMTSRKTRKKYTKSTDKETGNSVISTAGDT